MTYAYTHSYKHTHTHTHGTERIDCKHTTTFVNIKIPVPFPTRARAYICAHHRLHSKIEATQLMTINIVKRGSNFECERVMHFFLLPQSSATY